MQVTTRMKISSIIKSITVEPVFFLSFYVSFVGFITIQSFVYDKVCDQTFNSTVCDNLKNETFKKQENIVQKMTSHWILYLNLAMGIPSLFVVGLFLGPWGDTVGRKIPVIFPLVGQILAGISNALNAYFFSAPLHYILIGPFLNGLFGGYIATLMANYSYIAHISTPDNKTVKIGILEAMIFLAGTIGTGLAGVMLDNTSYLFVNIFLTGVALVALIYAIVRLENIKPERKTDVEKQDSCCKGVILGSIKDVIYCVYNKRKSKEFVLLAVLIFVIFLIMLDTVGENDVVLIFTRHPPLSWSQTTLGLFKGLETFLRGLSVLLILPLFKWKLKLRDTTIAIIGCASKAVAFTVMGMGKTTAVFFLAPVTGMLVGLTSAGIRSMCSSLVDIHEQAKMFSLVAIFETIAQLVSTSLFNNVYNATLEFYAGFCFLMAAGIEVLCIIIMSLVHFKLPGYQLYGPLQEDQEREVTNTAAEIGEEDSVSC